jgi:hypothetical protein
VGRTRKLRESGNTKLSLVWALTATKKTHIRLMDPSFQVFCVRSYTYQASAVAVRLQHR